MVTTSAMTHSIGLPADAAAVASVRELERRRQRGLLRARLFGGSAEPVRLGRFQIVRKLGEGGMGVVYLARDTRLNRLAALKFLPVIRRSDQELSRRFLQEAQAASLLDHPNICTIFEFSDSARQRRMFLRSHSTA